MSLIPFIKRGMIYAERSLVIRIALGDLWGQGQSLGFYGILLLASSRYSACIEKCREAVRILERTGDLWEVNIARYQLAASLYYLGELREAAEEAQRIHRSARELGDTLASGFSLDIWSRATRGKISPEIIQIELARPNKDAQRAAHIHLAEAVRLLAEKETGEAIKMLERACQICQQTGINHNYTVAIFPWLATALRLEAENFDDGSDQRKVLLRKARVAAHRGLRLARSFSNIMPHALREDAMLEALRGRGRKALRLFDKSLDVAKSHGARYEHAKTLLARGQVGLRFGWKNASSDIATAVAEIRSIEGSV